jgi:hypothetical protein
MVLAVALAAAGAPLLLSCRSDRDGGWAEVHGLRFRSEDQCLRQVDPDRLELARTDRPCAFEVESEKRLTALVLDFAAEVPTQIEVAGGEPGVRLFRPDGTVVLQVLLDPPEETGSGQRDRGSYRYTLRLAFPRGDGLPLRLTWAPEEAGESR